MSRDRAEIEAPFLNLRCTNKAPLPPPLWQRPNMPRGGVSAQFGNRVWGLLGRLMDVNFLLQTFDNGSFAHVALLLDRGESVTNPYQGSLMERLLGNKKSKKTFFFLNSRDGSDFLVPTPVAHYGYGYLARRKGAGVGELRSDEIFKSMAPLQRRCHDCRRIPGPNALENF